MNKNLYKEPVPISRAEAQLAFSSGKPQKICDALVRVTFNEPDWRWVQDECLRFIDNPNPDVRGLAVTCIGHIARIHGHLDTERVIERLKRIGKDDEIYGRVEDALDDIKTFINEK